MLVIVDTNLVDKNYPIIENFFKTLKSSLSLFHNLKFKNNEIRSE